MPLVSTYGRTDDKDALDKAWRNGVLRELQEWRKLMPWALTSGHSQGYLNQQHTDFQSIRPRVSAACTRVYK